MVQNHDLQHHLSQSDVCGLLWGSVADELQTCTSDGRRGEQMTEEKRAQLVHELDIIANAMSEIAEETELFITINADGEGYRCLAYTDLKNEETQIHTFDFSGALTEYVD